MYNSIIERRNVNDGRHSVVLEIPADEYNKIYDRYSDEIASEILQNHLENRGDDGRPSDVHIQHQNNSTVVRISANIDYLGNDHTEFRGHWEA
ncbi:hypothetical protein SDC9_139978 [bioreactor metagenome]|uniref:Uncharacterized protein n=1 Tax=bioreactor metagenome TaxID=1076179 RepID=A0A645DWY0_9ZZZZ|nr:hypothetical protein [Lutispora sp.]MEA4962246.1 hypothetical protein [Lutispora sp.]HCJ56348.1 hypothetical protein [Clostridiaceae bacterium]